jgi:ABC-type multidrug transport system ATPase subunit
MIRVAAVSKSFGRVAVLRRLSLTVCAGECVMLLGANGAGKSTLLRIVAGISRPDTGSVAVSGVAAGGAPDISLPDSSVRLGFFSQHLFLYGRLTVSENLNLYGGLLTTGPAGRGSAWSATTLQSVLEQWGLATYANTLVQDLSRGNQARVSLARTFLGDPSVVLLDEPSSHLDQDGVTILSAALRALRHRVPGGGAVVIATHDLHRLGGLATRAVVLARGGVQADSALVQGGTPASGSYDDLVRLYREGNR